jgi:hypothetical protein
MTKYYVFRKLLDFISEEYDVTDADMDNCLGYTEIAGVAEDGSTIKINVKYADPKEDEKDGN